MNNFNPELIAKAKKAKSAEELLALAKENGIDLTEDEARTYFEQLNTKGELSDDELDMVAGGCLFFGTKRAAKVPNVGRVVRVINGKSCPICATTVGVVAKRGSEAGSLPLMASVNCVKCQKCNEIILPSIYEGSTEDI